MKKKYIVVQCVLTYNIILVCNKYIVSLYRKFLNYANTSSFNDYYIWQQKVGPIFIVDWFVRENLPL